jgi:hypothetical protein
MERHTILSTWCTYAAVALGVALILFGLLAVIAVCDSATPTA